MPGRRRLGLPSCSPHSQSRRAEALAGLSKRWVIEEAGHSWGLRWQKRVAVVDGAALFREDAALLRQDVPRSANKGLFWIESSLKVTVSVVQFWRVGRGRRRASVDETPDRKVLQTANRRHWTGWGRRPEAWASRRPGRTYGPPIGWAAEGAHLLQQLLRLDVAPGGIAGGPRAGHGIIVVPAPNQFQVELPALGQATQSFPV